VRNILFDNLHIVKLIKHVVYGLAWAGYIVFCRVYYDEISSSVMIPSVLLIPLGAWLYGTTGGLLTLLATLPYHALVTSWLYAIQIEWPDQSLRIIGIPTQIMSVYFVGYLKFLLEKLHKLNMELDQKVIERTHELDTLTTQLISEDENLRINLAQSIHDGLGQHLTGLLLYSSSLEAALRNKNSRHADCAAALEENAQRNLQLARKVSRTLFPVRMSETGLLAALDELVSYFTETVDLKFDVQLDESHRHLTDQAALHLYRIVYEGILNALHYASPSLIRISLSGKNGLCRLLIENDWNGEARPMNNSMEVELMRYRMRHINGKFTIDTKPGIKTVVECKFPCQYSHENEAKESVLYA